jgi:hypothetical protein
MSNGVSVCDFSESWSKKPGARCLFQVKVAHNAVLETISIM